MTISSDENGMINDRVRRDASIETVIKVTILSLTEKRATLKETAHQILMNLREMDFDVVPRQIVSLEACDLIAGLLEISVSSTDENEALVSLAKSFLEANSKNQYEFTTL